MNLNPCMMEEVKKICTYDSVDLSAKLQKGAAVIFPTDTLPALASCPLFASQLWEIKRRPANKPFILMGSNSNQLFEYISKKALKDAQLMAKKFWPGALTMVLPASGGIVEALNPGESNLGMRVPACELAIDLLSRSGPLATTSANLSGELPSTNAKDAAKNFPELPLLGPLPWPSASGLASTVILWRSSGRWQVLRSGSLTLEVGSN
ncbi:L-threonylcarbamoyladenylate synthase [Prochlorococcus sp. MIT 1307]|uniref:L-threonylcarbamoyladenylate synthase n=1 Tax=Prochlorococcus sp. MIT 1307 TaxID=3096219 RepID=UPI002A75C790|nr:L-threonylcarbamoyladenylate synthase [Prochlorococcus sp. MIT 1307]